MELLTDKTRKVNRWRKAQEAEFKFYADVIKYQKFSEDYTYNPRAWDHIFRQFKFLKFDGKAILEIGCGVFGPLHYIQGRRTLRVGIDPLLDRLFKKVASKEIHYLRSIGENLPFTSEKFDVAICYNVLDHTVDPKKVFEETSRVLKPQGTFLLCVNIHSTMIRALNSLWRELDKEHPYHFGLDQVKYMMRLKGFRILWCSIVRSRPSISLLARLLKSAKFKAFFSFFFLSTMYVTARKFQSG